MRCALILRMGSPGKFQAVRPTHGGSASRRVSNKLRQGAVETVVKRYAVDIAPEPVMGTVKA